MIRLIYSYKKSAAVFSVMLAIAVAGIVLTCLYITDPWQTAIRIVGLVLLLIAVYTVSFTYVCRLISAEIEKVGYQDCDSEKLGNRLQKLSKRTFFGGVRASILLAYAYTQICRGLYKEAMESVSDAVTAGKDSVKGDAAVRFCQIYYMLGDAEYFAKYFDAAVETLGKYADAKSVFDRNTAHTASVALKAMQADLSGDKIKAHAILDTLENAQITPLQQKNLIALKAHIENA